MKVKLKFLQAFDMHPRDPEIDSLLREDRDRLPWHRLPWLEGSHFGQQCELPFFFSLASVKKEVPGTCPPPQPTQYSLFRCFCQLINTSFTSCKLDGRCT